jgi:hypothetical protein
MTGVTTDQASSSHQGLRLAVILFAASIITACTQNDPPPGSSKTMPTTCSDYLSQSACREGWRCRWINEHKRADGTSATARCVRR